MTNEKCLQVMKQYREILMELGAEEIEADYDMPYINDRGVALNHCLSMIPKMEKFIREGRRDKFFRWLGFMQGVFWAFGILSINEVRNHNRPPE